MSIWATGTVRANRKGLCPEVLIKKGEEKLLKKTPGFSRWASYGSLGLLAWFDKRPVHLLSYSYPPDDAGQATLRIGIRPRKAKKAILGRSEKE
jgi:hypothetical protein